MIINFNGIKIKTSEFVYTPGEDTFFVEESINKFLLSNDNLKFENIAEMGCGSGYILITLMKIFENAKFIGLDKNKYALDLTFENIELNNLTNKDIKLIQSNLFERLETQSFDLIVFNPPYLPVEKYEFTLEQDKILKESWEGGTPLINEFLTKVEKFLSIEGIIMIVLSNYQIVKDQINNYLSKINPKFRIITYYKKKLLLETLYFVILKVST